MITMPSVHLPVKYKSNANQTRQTPSDTPLPVSYQSNSQPVHASTTSCVPRQSRADHTATSSSGKFHTTTPKQRHVRSKSSAVTKNQSRLSNVDDSQSVSQTVSKRYSLALPNDVFVLDVPQLWLSKEHEAKILEERERRLRREEIERTRQEEDEDDDSGTLQMSQLRIPRVNSFSYMPAEDVSWNERVIM